MGEMKEGMPLGSHDAAQAHFHSVPVITTADLVRLTDMMEYLTRSGQAPTRSLLVLKKRLACCKVMPFSAIASDRITMRSRVEMQNLDSGAVGIFTLVYPKEVDAASGHVSVLSPMGTAMLGSQRGDVIFYEGEDGIRRYRVLRVVYQPEAAGDYHL